jgi:nitrogen regulatory protein PII
MEQRKLVTIITESAIESQLLEDLDRLGAKGYTILEARGRGSHGVRVADWDQNQNLRIEVICTDRVASAIVEHCQKAYSDNYALVAYISDVQVFRPEKF